MAPHAAPAKHNLRKEIWEVVSVSSLGEDGEGAAFIVPSLQRPSFYTQTPPA